MHTERGQTFNTSINLISTLALHICDAACQKKLLYILSLMLLFAAYHTTFAKYYI